MKISDIDRGFAGMNSGMWVGDLPDDFFVGIRLKVRRMFNPDYSALHAQLTAEAERRAAGDLTADQRSAITTECLLQTSLIGWEGIDEPFSIDVARQVFAMPHGGDAFRNMVIWAATSVGKAARDEIDSAVKN